MRNASTWRVRISRRHSPGSGEGPKGFNGFAVPAVQNQNSENGSHIVQLFDTSESVADAVSGFVRTGLAGGGTVLAVMSPDQWGLAAGLLAQSGTDVETAIQAGRLTVRDGAATLAGFMRHGAPRAELFEEAIGTLVSRLRARGTRLSVYGDMVDRLAEQGEFSAARTLEDFWNQLRARCPFTLFCGYSSIHFGNPSSVESLRQICGRHSHVHTHERDLLGTYLLTQCGSTIPPHVDAPTRVLPDEISIRENQRGWTGLNAD